MTQTTASADPDDNPLLAYGALPRFDEAGAGHVQPAIRAILERAEGELEALERDASPSWEGIVLPLAAMGERLSFAWSIVQHLMGVKNSDALREAHDAVQSDVVVFSLRQGQSRPIYDALDALRNASAWSQLEPAQQRIVDSLLRDMRHSGVGLAETERERFNEIAQQLAEFSTQFSNHVLDATTGFSLTLREPADLDGLPANAVELAAQSARDAGEEGATADNGPWRITLDFPSFHPFMENSTRRELREQLYRAYVTRASTGELDNAPLIEQILVLKAEQAKLLGYADYAELSLSAKMAPDVEAATDLLERLRGASVDAAKADLDELQAFAREQGAPEGGMLRHWDISYWSERLREHRYAYSEEELRPYFPLPRVLDGLFALAQRLLGVSIEAADGQAPVWHQDVRFFRVSDREGQPIAGFYLDPYSRPAEKRGGAWMDECVGRALAVECPGWSDLHEGVRLPVAHLVCNQTPPVGDRPSLMSFDEVRTLFHEFGHGLQHMLTRVDYGLAAGIRNIEWDAVELPSQFMENWCYHRETLDEITSHVETGASLPDELFQKLLAARTYRAGSDMLRQLYFALTDLELHRRADPRGESAFDVQRRVAERTTVLAPLPEDRFLCSFGHIFAGGYAAGYYSYKWAEVLSADAFAAFEEAGIDDPVQQRETGARYRETVLALGGSVAPMEVFKAFRGREPSPEALLRHSGLAAA